MQNSIGKTTAMISALPANPSKHIYWIVYSEDMVRYAEEQIKLVRGEDYFNRHVTVVAKNDPSKERTTGTLYFDPRLLDLLGNGNI